jgi:tRNA modification GTPase
MHTPDNHDTIAAIATPQGSAGIGIIRISGPDALGIARRIFRTPAFSSANIIPRYLYHGRIIDFRDDAQLDEVLLSFMQGPRSYTGDDVVEINAHGGITATRAVLELVLACGARPAAPGEFTRRAFLNGRIDLAQAEAVIDMIESSTGAGLKIAARQMSGALSARVAALREELVNLRAHFEACIDFPDDDIDVPVTANAAKVLSQQCALLSNMINDGRSAMRYRTGIDAVIAGKPNVGKSSIMNVLLGDERSIVTPVPGTTRDVIRETISIAGIPVRLHDTAGIHSSTDAVETIGMDRALNHLLNADITLLVFDGSQHLDADDRMLLERKQDRNCMAIINKSDRDHVLVPQHLATFFNPDMIVSVSALNRTGFDALLAGLARLVTGNGVPSASDVLITSLRHVQALQDTLTALERAETTLKAQAPFELVSADVQDALHNLGAITGETTADDILDAIFDRFCIGK